MNVTPTCLQNEKPNRNWYQPYARAAKVQDISMAQLHALKVCAVMLDLDDTLLPTGGSSIAPEVVAWVRQLQAAGLSVLLLSNGTLERVRRSAAQLGVDSIALAGKPAAVAFWRGLRRLQCPAEQVVMIGDQLFTDVIGANLMNIKSILVDPLSDGLWHTKHLRYLETRILETRILEG
jgi:HAD superfamily phosphatase (TIGR01668 family)